MEADDFLSSEDMLESVSRYERMLQNNEYVYFDAEVLEDIVDFYTQENKLKKALQVIEYAHDQFPYSTAFLIRKAQINSMLGEFVEGLLALDKAESTEPYNYEIFLVRGEILDQQEFFLEAIQSYEKGPATYR